MPKYKLVYLSGHRAENTNSILDLLEGLEVPFSLHNDEQHIIAEAPVGRLHIWGANMKWRFGESGGIKQGTLAGLKREVQEWKVKPLPVYAPQPLQAVLELKQEWLSNPTFNMSARKGFEAHKAELNQFQSEWLAQVDALAIQRAEIVGARAQAKALEHSLTLPLHETMRISPEVTILRVPTGWLYTTTCKANGHKQADSVATTFVPETLGACDEE